MTMFSRLSKFAKNLLILFLFCFPATGWTNESSIAIIDTAWDTRDHLQRLQDRGVVVIGRYLGRCPVPGLGEYRLIDQGLPSDPNSEISQIMAHGIAVLSIYQFRSKSTNKLRGRDADGAVLPDADCNQTTIPRSVSEEAELDAAAAVRQARALGQPTNVGTAIYFGVDFELERHDLETQELLVEYFRTLKPIVEEAGYSVGAYGSGLTLQILQDAPDGSGNTGLIDFAWIMASASFPGSSALHRSGNWDLFQNEVDEQWFGTPGSGNVRACNGGVVLDIDTNVQNPGHAQNDVGFWTLDGSYAVAEERTRAIFDQRRNICNGNAILRATSRSDSTDYTDAMRCHRNMEIRFGSTIPFISSVWLTGRQVGNLVEVDVNEDGQPDGWTWVNNLTSNFGEKPDYLFEGRAQALCD